MNFVLRCITLNEAIIVISMDLLTILEKCHLCEYQDENPIFHFVPTADDLVCN